MAYNGPKVICERCGATFSRPSDRRRHLAEYRCPGRLAKGGRSRSVAIVPVKPRAAHREPIRAEVIDVTPIRSEIVHAERQALPATPVLVRSESEPEWFAREFPQDARAVPWRKRDEESREYYRQAHAGMERLRVSLPRRPDDTDSVTLWEQYHFLKALAVRLDAGRGTDRDRELFQAGLLEYNARFDRIAQRKALPG
jgi:hypothetical protein